MLIVLTQDGEIIEWVGSDASGADAWGTLKILSEGGNPTATVAMKALLKQVGPSEPLCVTGHGNDHEIGDESISGKRSWTWGVSQFADLLIDALPANYSGPVLIETCAETQNNFSHRLANELGDRGKLGDVTIYGYRDAVDVTHPFPAPDRLADDDELTKDNVVVDLGLGLKLEAKKPTPPAPSAPTTITAPPASAAAYNQPTRRSYVINETGNIMLSTTSPDAHELDPSAQQLFQEVAVFFAAMTKAITSTPRPGTKPPYAQTDYYTIYDYVPLENIVNRSGLFVNVHREDFSYETKQETDTFNLEFIEAALGIVLTDGIGAGPLLATMNSMGKTATFGYSSTGKYQKIGNLLFLCEYLFGMPLVSVLYFYLDEEQVEHVLSVGPCWHHVDKKFQLSVHKDTFMFVSPEWISRYAGSLAEVADEPEFQQLVHELEAYISNTPVILSVQGATGPVTELTGGSSYTLEGINLGTAPGTLSIAGKEQTVPKKGWTDSTVSFTAASPEAGSGGPIVITTATASGELTATSPLDYPVHAKKA